jgi:hypothetical protein
VKKVTLGLVFSLLAFAGPAFANTIVVKNVVTTLPHSGSTILKTTKPAVVVPTTQQVNAVKLAQFQARTVTKIIRSASLAKLISVPKH